MRSITKLVVAAGLAATVSLAMAADKYWIRPTSGAWSTLAHWGGGLLPTADDDVYLGYNNQWVTFTNPLGITVTHGTNRVTVRNLRIKTNLTLPSVTVTDTMNIGAGAIYNSTQGTSILNQVRLHENSQWNSYLATADNVYLGANSQIKSTSLVASFRAKNTHVEGNSKVLGNSTFLGNVFLQNNATLSLTQYNLEASDLISGEGRISAPTFNFQFAGSRDTVDKFLINNATINVGNNVGIGSKLQGTSRINGSSSRLLNGFSGKAEFTSGTHHLYGNSNGELVTGAGVQITNWGTIEGKFGSIINRGYANLKEIYGGGIYNYGTLNLDALHYYNNVLTDTYNYGEIKLSPGTTHSLQFGGTSMGMVTLGTDARLQAWANGLTVTSESLRFLHLGSKAQMNLYLSATGATAKQIINTGAILDLGATGPGLLSIVGGIKDGTVLNAGRAQFFLNGKFENVHFPGTQELRTRLNVDGYTFTPQLINLRSDAGDNLSVRAQQSNQTLLKDTIVRGRISLDSYATNLSNVSVRPGGALEANGSISAEGLTNYGNMTLWGRNFTGVTVKNYGTMFVRTERFALGDMMPNFGTLEFDHANADLSGVRLENYGIIRLRGRSRLNMFSARLGTMELSDYSAIHLRYAGSFEAERSVISDATSSVNIWEPVIENISLDNEDYKGRKRSFWTTRFSNVNILGSGHNNFFSVTFDNSQITGNFDFRGGEVGSELTFLGTQVPENSYFRFGRLYFGGNGLMPEKMTYDGGWIQAVDAALRLEVKDIDYNYDLSLRGKTRVLGDIRDLGGGTYRNLSLYDTINYGDLTAWDAYYLTGENHGSLTVADDLTIGSATSPVVNHGLLQAPKVVGTMVTNHGTITKPSGAGSLSFTGVNHGFINFPSNTTITKIAGQNFGRIVVGGTVGASGNLMLVNEASGELEVTGPVNGSLTNRGMARITGALGTSSFPLTIINSGELTIISPGENTARVSNTGILVLLRNSSGRLPTFRTTAVGDAWGGNLRVVGSFSFGFQHTFVRLPAGYTQMNTINMLTPGWIVRQDASTITLAFVPEPGSMTVLGLAALALMRRKSRQDTNSNLGAKL